MHMVNWWHRSYSTYTLLNDIKHNKEEGSWQTFSRKMRYKVEQQLKLRDKFGDTIQIDIAHDRLWYALDIVRYKKYV